jgi:16S rRNA (cytidine1402-2'-O)-methyltransferase
LRKRGTMMNRQKSYEKNDATGTLYLVPTPIGNLEDMTFRAIRMLKEVNVIAAEDTRNTKKLANYFEISTPIVSYHEHNKERSGQQLVERLKNGEDVALVSDAGMPTISDPGIELVQQAIAEQIPVVPLPGANAALTALIASGIATQPFYFYGFLHRNKKEKREELDQLKNQKATLIFYEAPHRLKETLLLMKEVWDDRQIVLCRELTKKFEEFLRGTLTEAIEWASSEEVRGEFCIVVEGAKEGSSESEDEMWWTPLSIIEHVHAYIENEQMSAKDAIKQVAKDRSMPKREVYQLYHQ